MRGGILPFPKRQTAAKAAAETSVSGSFLTPGATEEREAGIAYVGMAVALFLVDKNSFWH